MAVYIVQSQLQAYLSNAVIVQMLDDSGGGAQDTAGQAAVFAQVAGAASTEVDGRLAPTYAVPMATGTPMMQAATVIFTCEALYARRGTPDERNPFKARADWWRDRLDMIGKDGHGLDATVARSFPPVSWVSTPSMLTDSTL